MESWMQAAQYGLPFNTESVPAVPPRGHVVAVRVTSEDPNDGFKPTSGRVEVRLDPQQELSAECPLPKRGTDADEMSVGLQELNFRSKPDVWAYFSIKVLKGEERKRGV